jgi:hypothetical protein
VFDMLKRLLVGRPQRSARLGETLLPKWLALPVFCSDPPISSVAYATEQIVLVLGAGGLAALTFTPWVGLAVVVLLWSWSSPTARPATPIPMVAGRTWSLGTISGSLRRWWQPVRCRSTT